MNVVFMILFMCGYGLRNDCMLWWQEQEAVEFLLGGIKIGIVRNNLNENFENLSVKRG